MMQFVIEMSKLNENTGIFLIIKNREANSVINKFGSLEAVVRACSDRARLLIAGGFGAAVTPPLALVTASLGALVVVVAVVLEMRGFAVLWLLTGSVLLLGRSSGLVPVGEVAEAEGKRTQESIMLIIHYNKQNKVDK